jgi:hypothetical protein
MKAGGYYDLHSEYQRRVIEEGEHLIRSATAALDLRSIAGALTVVDYGAGTGATSVQAMLTAVDEVRERDRDRPVVALHNDVITNDFSQLFRNIAAPGGYLALPGGPVYPSAVAGSFFTQVVPSATVHLAMCSNAAHWLREQLDVRVEGGMYFPDAHGAVRPLQARCCRRRPARALRDVLRPPPRGDGSRSQGRPLRGVGPTHPLRPSLNDAAASPPSSALPRCPCHETCSPRRA